MKSIELIVLSEDEALKFEPKRPTYSIRIFPSCYENSSQIRSLRPSNNYVKTDCYFFDVSWSFVETMNYIIINDEIAAKIIENFKKVQNSVDCAMIHCSRGLNRSPAVAIALNDIFGPWYEKEELEKKYPKYDIETYKKIINLKKIITSNP